MRSVLGRPPAGGRPSFFEGLLGQAGRRIPTYAIEQLPSSPRVFGLGRRRRRCPSPKKIFSLPLLRASGEGEEEGRGLARFPPERAGMGLDA